jgi:Tfp pilus assembly protein PilN
MRAPINLATEPFRKDRPLFVASAAGTVVLTLLLAFLITLIVSARSRAASTRSEIERLNRQIDALSAEQARLDMTMRQPGNAEVLERSVLLNALIERKGISWTRIFGDLEQVMPYNVRLMQIRLPQVSIRNRVTLDMVVGAQSPEPVLDFLRRVEGSPLFGPAEVSAYMPPGQNEPLYRYRVSVSYAQKL